MRISMDPLLYRGLLFIDFHRKDVLGKAFVGGPMGCRIPRQTVIPPLKDLITSLPVAVSDCYKVETLNKYCFSLNCFSR